MGESYSYILSYNLKSMLSKTKHGSLVWETLVYNIFKINKNQIHSIVVLIIQNLEIINCIKYPAKNNVRPSLDINFI